MLNFLRRLIVFVTLSVTIFASSVLPAVETFIEKISSKEFPKQIQIEHLGTKYTLDVTGAAVRRKWFVKGYVLAHYLEKPVKGDQRVALKEVLSKDRAKQFTMIWLHRLPLHLIQEGYKETLEKVIAENNNQSLQPFVNQYLNLFKKDAEVGDVHQIRWFPGGNLELIINGEKAGGFVNADFAKTLWLMWFGTDSVVDRESLIKYIVN